MNELLVFVNDFDSGKYDFIFFGFIASLIVTYLAAIFMNGAKDD